MLDLAFIRDNPEVVRLALADLYTEGPLDEILALDAKRRQMLVEIEALRAERNRVSKEIPRIKDKDEKQGLIAEMRTVGDRIIGLNQWRNFTLAVGLIAGSNIRL